MLENLNVQTFAEQLNTKFTIPVSDSDALVLELIKAEDTGSSPRQEQFSLIFRGPADRAIPQGTYRMEHDNLGQMNLFLVPVAKQEDGMHYQAVFNRFRES